MTKEELRKIYLQKRRSLSDIEYEQMSADICENFFNHIDLSSITFLHTFIPIEKNREPNTWFIIDRLQKRFPQINLVIPSVNHDTGEMESFHFEGFDQLEKNKWGISEPKKGKQIEPREIDLVVIPLLAFDEEGHRVGYGKGYYDRFLTNCRSNCKKIGLSIYPPIKQIINKQANDILMDCCVTPEMIYAF